MFPDGGNAAVPVTELTLSEVMKTPLKCGSRAPLLTEVLASALAIGPHAKMCVEIKPGNTAMPKALSAIFKRRPELLKAVALFMSFDNEVIHQFSRLFAAENGGAAALVPAAERPHIMFLTSTTQPDGSMPPPVEKQLFIDDEEMLMRVMSRPPVAQQLSMVDVQPCETLNVS